MLTCNTRLEDIVVLRLDVRLTASKPARDLQRRIDVVLRKGYRNVVLDLEDTCDVDATGLGVLVECYNVLSRRGGQLRLFRVPERIRFLLRISKLAAVFGTDRSGRRSAGADVHRPHRSAVAINRSYVERPAWPLSC